MADLRPFVVTHDGPFHADEVMAVAILDRFFVRGGYTLKRTRDPDIIARADMALDVGGVYDPGNWRFDHHQRGFTLRRPNDAPYATAGLVWRALGEAIVSPEVHEIVDKFLLQGIDLVDCGEATAEQAHGVAIASISDAISNFNVPWDGDPSMQDRQFADAAHFAGGVLDRTIARAEASVRAREGVAQAITHAKGAGLEYVVLERFAPWKTQVCRDYPTALYVIHPAHKGGYHVTTVPETPASFVSKLPFPEAWGGLEGEELQRVTGVAGARFAHRGRFLVGVETYEDAKKIVSLALGLDD